MTAVSPGDVVVFFYTARYTAKEHTEDKGSLCTDIASTF